MSEQLELVQQINPISHNPLSLFKNFIEEYNIFKKKADDYRDNGEIEGSLINYKLAANSLHHALLLKETEPNLMNFINSNPELKSWCTNVCTRIEELLRELLRYISPLQDELKKRKLSQGGRNNDSDLGNCDDIFSKQIVLEGKNCIDFNDVIGLQDVKDKLFNGFIYPSIYKNLFPNTAKGILFYGPPGTGKSFIAKAAANELDQPIDDPYMHVLYFAPQGGDLKGKYVGETEKNIQKFFKCASEAATKCKQDLNDKETDQNKKRHHVLSILFLDEVDAIAGDRLEDSSGMMSLSVNALLQALEGLGSKANVSVLAATNLPWSLDSAFLRRFESKVLIGLPSKKDIKSLLEYNINQYLKKLDNFINEEVKKEDKLDRKTKKNDISCVGKCDKKKKQKKENLVLLYKEFMPNLTQRGLNAVAISMNEKNYSPSDVSKVCSSIFRNVGDRARKNNTFYKTNYNAFSKEIGKTNNTKSKNIFISTLSLTELMKNSQKRQEIENNLTLIQPLTSNDYKSITVGNISYINKSLLGIETFLNDPNVDTFYIYNADHNIIQVLFKIDIGFQYSDETTDTKEFYIMSSIDKKKLENGMFSWLGNYNPFGKKQLTKEEKEKNLSSYEELINNMSQLLYRPPNRNSTKFYIADTFDNKFKNSLKNRQFTEVDLDYKNNFQAYVDVEAEGKFDFTTSIFTGRIDIEFEKVSSESDSERLERESINKDAFFTFDIRDSDFIGETARTAGSVKASEYTELLKYQEDPSIYKPKKTN